MGVCFDGTPGQQPLFVRGKFRMFASMKPRKIITPRMQIYIYIIIVGQTKHTEQILRLKGRLKGHLKGRLKGCLKGRLKGCLKGHLKGRLRGRLKGCLKGRLKGRLKGKFKNKTTKYAAKLLYGASILLGENLL